MDHPPTQIKQSPHAQQHSHMRHASWASSVDNNPSPVQPRKRSADASMADGPVARKGRACLACRKLKVKCDSLDRGDAGCSRCQRLGIECITSKRLRMSLEDESGYVVLALEVTTGLHTNCHHAWISADSDQASAPFSCATRESC